MALQTIFMILYVTAGIIVLETILSMVWFKPYFSVGIPSFSKEFKIKEKGKIKLLNAAFFEENYSRKIT